MNYPTLDTADLSGKKVLLRAGFDVPMENGVVKDTTRIEAIVPTMQYILDHGGALIIMAHQGRPKGEPLPEFSQKPLVPVLEKLLGVPVQFAERCIGEDTRAKAQALQAGGVLLLENLRYEAGEKSKDQSERDRMGQELASFADVYVNDAFTNCHRDHASMTSVPKFMAESYIGLNVQREIEGLSLVTQNPKQPLVLIISGAKAETKVPVVEHFVGRASDIIVGGCVTNTFLAASGVDIKNSRHDADFIATAKEILSKADIRLPSDVICAQNPEGPSHAVSTDAIPGGEAIFDIGPESVAQYEDIIAGAGTIVWNGPLGMYEVEAFAQASLAIAAAIKKATANGAVSVLGGGDTLDVHERYGLSLDDYTYASTAGGAMLDFISGKELPALTALQ